MSLIFRTEGGEQTDKPTDKSLQDTWVMSAEGELGDEEEGGEVYAIDAHDLLGHGTGSIRTLTLF